MLHHQQPPPPPPPEGGVFASPHPGLPHHLLPPSSDDLPHQSYSLSQAGLLSDAMPPPPPPSGGFLMAPHQGRTDFALSPGAELQHQQQPQHQQPQHQNQGSWCGYDRLSGLLGLSLNPTCSDDLALLPGLSADFSSAPYLPSHGGQAPVHLVTARARCPPGQIHGASLLPPHAPQQQQHHEMTTMTTTTPIGYQLSSNHHQSKPHHLLLQQESAKQAIIHQASLQQQVARMAHLTLHDPFANSTKGQPLKPGAALSPHPVLPPHLTLQPPPVSSHPSPAGLSMLGPQSLLQQPPQSPRRAPSPISEFCISCRPQWL